MPESCRAAMRNHSLPSDVPDETLIMFAKGRSPWITMSIIPASIVPEFHKVNLTLSTKTTGLVLVDMELSASFLTDLQYSFSYRSWATSWVVTQRIPNLRTCTFSPGVSDEKDHLRVRESSEVLHSFRRTSCTGHWDGSCSSIQLQDLLQLSSRSEDSRRVPCDSLPCMLPLHLHHTFILCI